MPAKKGKGLYLFIRAGDGDNYHSFSTTDAVADYLFENGARWKLSRINQFGLTGRGFRDWNYISAYWGVIASEPESRITDREIAALNKKLKALELEKNSP